MLLWVIICIACLIVVGTLLSKNDEAHQQKRKLRQIQQRLEEKREAKDQREEEAASREGVKS